MSSAHDNTNKSVSPALSSQHQKQQAPPPRLAQLTLHVSPNTDATSNRSDVKSVTPTESGKERRHPSTTSPTPFSSSPPNFRSSPSSPKRRTTSPARGGIGIDFVPVTEDEDGADSTTTVGHHAAGPSRKKVSSEQFTSSSRMLPLDRDTTSTSPTSKRGCGPEARRKEDARIADTGDGDVLVRSERVSPSSTLRLGGGMGSGGLVSPKTPILSRSASYGSVGNMGAAAKTTSPSKSAPHQHQQDRSFKSYAKAVNASISADILHPNRRDSCHRRATTTSPSMHTKKVLSPATSNQPSPLYAAGRDDVVVVEDDEGEEGGNVFSRSASTVLSFVGVGGGHHRSGTVFGLTFNTLTNVMGAGVLSLPLATYNGSIVISVLLLFVCAALSCFSIFALTLGCELTQKYSYTECFAFTLFPSAPWRKSGAKKANSGGQQGRESGEGEGNKSVYGVDSQSRSSTGNDGDEHGSGELAAAVGVDEMKTDDTDDINDEIDEGIIVANEGEARRRRRWATLLLELVIFLNGFGTVTIYSRIIADSMPPVMAAIGWSGQNKDNILSQELFWIIVPGIVFFGLSCVRNMDELKWTSIVGFLTILYIVLAVVWRFFSNLFVESIIPREGQIGYIPSVSEKQSELRWFHLSMSCFSTVASYSLAYAYHFNVPYFYNELEDRRPKTMMRGAAISFPIITASYGATGLFGYFTFGSLVASAAARGSIVNNYGEDDTLITIGRVGLFFHFATVYPIISICCRRGLHRIVCVLFSSFKQKQQGQQSRSATSSQRNEAEATRTAEGTSSHVENNNNNKPPPGDPRTTQMRSIVIEAFFIVTVSSLFAALVSGIGSVVHVVGTLFGTPIVFIFPGLIGMCIFHDDVPTVVRVVATEFMGEAEEDGDGAAASRGGGDTNDKLSVIVSIPKGAIGNNIIRGQKDEGNGGREKVKIIGCTKGVGPSTKVSERIRQLQMVSRVSLAMGVIFLVCGTYVVTKH